MARNIEKAQSMLHRFREAQMAELGISVPTTRPRNPWSIEKLTDAERFRGQILREISQKVTKIQDSNLNEHQIRDLNDEINALFREKHKWEIRIKELGGSDHARRRVALFDEDGRPVPIMKGYKYFGRARELPGVKELLETRRVIDQKKEMQKAKPMGMFYYGYFEDEDLELEAIELELQERAHTKEQEFPSHKDNMTEEHLPTKKTRTGSTSLMQQILHEDLSQIILQPEMMPTLQETEAWLVKRRQKELMAKYGL